MTDRQILGLLSAGRVVVGLAMVAAPKEVGRRWFGPDGANEAGGAMIKIIGIRDAALGVAGLHAARSGDARAWLAAGVAVDGVDCLSTLKADGIPKAAKYSSALVAGGAAAANLAGVAIGLAAGEGDASAPSS